MFVEFLEILFKTLKLLCNYDELVKMCGCIQSDVQLGGIIMGEVLGPGI